ncbi:hypothetical protein [Hydrogenivirga sp.]
MRPLRDIGVVERNGDGWRVKHDVLKTIEEFERIRKKIGFEGDLFEFVTEVFKKTRELLKTKTVVEELAQEHGVSPGPIVELLEVLLDEIIWRTEDDLRKLAEDIRSGRIVFIADEVRKRLHSSNAEDIKHLSLCGDMTEDEALIFVLNNLLSFIPVSLSLWREVESVAGAGNIEVWIKDKIVEDKAGGSYELIPVNGSLFRKMESEVSELDEKEREKMKERFVKGVHSLMEKIAKEARGKNLRKKLKKK